MYLWRPFLMHRHCYVTALNFSTGINGTPGGDSWPGLWVKQASEPGTEILIKTLDLGANLLSPSGKALTRLFSLLPQLSKCQELIHGCITLKLRGGTLTRTKWPHFMFLLSMLWLYFSDGPDNQCMLTSADSKGPKSAIWPSRQCLPVLGSLLHCLPQSV